MNCSSCDPSLFQGGTSDKTITYTGPSIEALGICSGVSLNNVEAVLLQKILDYATGVGISIPSIDLSTCALFQQNLTCCTTCTDLPCLMQAYLTALCTLFGDVTTLQSQIAAINGPYNVGCLAVASNATLAQIIQDLILEFCALKAAVTTLQSQVNSIVSNLSTTIGNQILSALSTCQTPNLVKSGSGATAAIAFKGFVPIGTILPAGRNLNLANFDSTGLGFANTEACGWALANGNNGTDDMREEVPVGAGAGIMGGGTLPTNVSGANYPLGAIVGSVSVLLTSAESGVGSHTHTITDPKHRHGYIGRTDSFKFGSDRSVWDALSPSSPDGSPGSLGDVIDFQPTGITINPSGSLPATSAHENRQPSKAVIYIQRIA